MGFFYTKKKEIFISKTNNNLIKHDIVAILATLYIYNLLILL